MKRAFRPPKLNPFVVKLVQAILPGAMMLPAVAIESRFSPEDIRKIKTLKGKRLLLLPNHPSSEDPLLMMAFSKAVGINFNYIAAREVFELWHGVNGWLLEHCGTYSVIRGKADRDSFKMTRHLMAKAKRPLVVFIEGEVSSENDTLLPFESGVLQLAFKALEDVQEVRALRLKKSATKLGKTLPPIDASFYVAPVIIKYFYAPGVEQAVDQGLCAMERAAGLPEQPGISPYIRFRALGQVVLQVHEKALNIKPEENDSIQRRAANVKERLLGQMERYLALDVPDAGDDPNRFYLDRIRAIRNRIDALVYSYEDTDEFSDYERHNLEQRQKTFSGFYQQLGTLVNFMTFQEGRVVESAAIADSLLSDEPSFHEDKDSPQPLNLERMMELVHRLEKEILGKAVTHHPRTAVLQLGEIRNLAERLDAYEQDKRKTVSDLTHELESEMALTLKQMERPN